MQKSAFIAFFVALFAAFVAADVAPSCLLKCLMNYEPSDYKAVCTTDAGKVAVCLDETCTGDFLKAANDNLVATCKTENYTVDIKKVLASATKEALPTKTNPATKPEFTDSPNEDSTDSADDKKDDESSAGKLSAGFVGISALIMAVLAL